MCWSLTYLKLRADARTLIGWGGGCIFIYSGSARLVSFVFFCSKVDFKRIKLVGHKPNI